MRLPFAALALLGCGLGSGPGSPVPPDELLLQLPDDPAAYFLVVEEHPGFVPVEYALNQPPRFAATVGGRLIAAGVRTGFPGAMLPPASWIEIGRAAREPIVAAVARSGLPQAEDSFIPEPSGRIADLGSTTFTLRDRSGERRITVEGFDLDAHDDPRIPWLRDVARRLEEAARAGVPADPGPPRLLLYVNADPGIPAHATERPWPLPDPPPPSDFGFECRLHEGETAARLLARFETADLAARWVFDGEPFQLIARRLFPGEEGCPP